MANNGMDHLVFGVSDLQHGIDLIEQRTGVRARFGGRHQGRGTHNALMGLGERQYLEIIAPDPEQAGTLPTMFPHLANLTEPQFIAWAVAVDDIEAIASKARAAHYQLREPVNGSRMRPDGKMLTWRSLVIAAPAIPLVPFFIQWGRDTPHPSQDAPPGCKLTSLAIEHPEADRIQAMLQTLGVDVKVVPGAHPRLRAQLQTPAGAVEIS